MAGLYCGTGSRYQIAVAAARHARDLMKVGRLVSRLNRCGSIPRTVEFPRPGLESLAHQRTVIGAWVGDGPRRGHCLSIGCRVAEDRLALGAECGPEVNPGKCHLATMVGAPGRHTWKIYGGTPQIMAFDRGRRSYVPLVRTIRRSCCKPIRSVDRPGILKPSGR